MGNKHKLKISWENDLWQSVGEQDVLKLRNQLKIIRSSLGLNKNERLHNEYTGKVMENNF